MKELAWRSDNELTPRGEEECNENFEGIVYPDFHILNDKKEDCFEFAVSWRCQPNKIFNVVIPKAASCGSYFGCCSCGVDKRDGVPCDHMAAIVKSSRVPVLTIYNIMPYWWMRKTWQLQFPFEEEPV